MFHISSSPLPKGGIRKYIPLKLWQAEFSPPMASTIAVDAIRGKTCRPWAEGPGPGRKGRQVWARLWGCVQHNIVSFWFL